MQTSPSSRHASSSLLAALASIAFAPVAAAQWVTPPSPSPFVQQHTFASAAAGQTVSYHVMLPPGYALNPERRYPVVYWLHGANAVLSGMGLLGQWYFTGMTQGLVPPALVVFPNGMPYGMWTDSKDGAVPIETVVIDELLPEIDGKFRTIPNLMGRILEGFSMGGYGAARLGFEHHNLFAGVSILGSAALQLNFLDTPAGSSIPDEVYLEIYQDVWGSDPTYFLEQGPRARAEANLPGILATGQRVRLAVGQADFVAPTNLDFQAFLVALGLPHGFFFPAGIGHQQMAVLNHLVAADPEFYREQFESLGPGGGAIVPVPGCTPTDAWLSASPGAVAIGGTLELELGAPPLSSAWSQLYVALGNVQPDGCGISLAGVGELLLGTQPILLAQAPLGLGLANYALAVPADPAWIGLEFALQGVILASPSGSLTIQLSNALNLRIGQ